MIEASWDIHRWKEVFEVGGTAAALLFTGVALSIDARVRRAQTVIEITKQHRELWLSVLDRPQLSSLFDRKRDLRAHPLTNEEVHFVNFMIHHLRATFIARGAGIFVQPEQLVRDMKEFFSLSSVAEVWARQKQFHDRKFVAFVEQNIGK